MFRSTTKEEGVREAHGRATVRGFILRSSAKGEGKSAKAEGEGGRAFEDFEGESRTRTKDKTAQPSATDAVERNGDTGK